MSSEHRYPTSLMEAPPLPILAEVYRVVNEGEEESFEIRGGTKEPRQFARIRMTRNQAVRLIMDIAAAINTAPNHPQLHEHRIDQLVNDDAYYCTICKWKVTGQELAARYLAQTTQRVGR